MRRKTSFINISGFISRSQDSVADAAGARLWHEEQTEDRDEKGDAEDKEAIGIRHRESVDPHLIRELGDRLHARLAAAWRLCRDDVAELLDGLRRARAVLGQPLRDDREVEMLAHGQVGRQHRDPDRAAEIAHNVEDRRALRLIAMLATY